MDWAAISDSLGSAATKGEPLLPVLRERAPDVVAQLTKDRQHPEWMRLWGRSLNVDANAHATIVEPSVLDALNQLAGVPPREGSINHAGIQHTYGYLLSNLSTPYGFKRDRWIKPDLNLGFGLPPQTLSPGAREGTLLSNLTYFAGRIALGDSPAALALLDRYERRAALVLREFPYTELKCSRVEETVTVDAASGRPRELTLRSDLVAFPNRVAGSSNTSLLIYSVKDASEAHPRLITLFPVGSSFVGTLLEPSSLGSGKPVIAAYNAYIEGLSDSPRPLTGTRRAARCGVNPRPRRAVAVPER